MLSGLHPTGGPFARYHWNHLLLLPQSPRRSCASLPEVKGDLFRLKTNQGLPRSAHLWLSYALLTSLSQNVFMSSSNPTGPYRAIGWTLFFLSLAIFLSYIFLPRGGPVPSEEMQVREVEQRAHERLNSN